MASCRVDRNLALAPRSGQAWPLGEPSSLALVSQPVVLASQVARFWPAPAAQPP
jgi:hypothetical protein